MSKLKFDKDWTRRAVIVLRNLQTNAYSGLIQQAHGAYGKADKNGHGSFCATQGLIEFLDALRGMDRASAQAWIDRNLALSSTDIINLNDDQHLSFGSIAAQLEAAGGGREALQA